MEPYRLLSYQKPLLLIFFSTLRGPMKYFLHLPGILPMRLPKRDRRVLLSPAHSFPAVIINPCDTFQYQRLYNFYISFLRTIFLFVVTGCWFLVFCFSLLVFLFL